MCFRSGEFNGRVSCPIMVHLEPVDWEPVFLTCVHGGLMSIPPVAQKCEMACGRQDNAPPPTPSIWSPVNMYMVQVALQV